jgi:hypothetical protein
MKWLAALLLVCCIFGCDPGPSVLVPAHIGDGQVYIFPAKNAQGTETFQNSLNEFLAKNPTLRIEVIHPIDKSPNNSQPGSYLVIFVEVKRQDPDKLEKP